MAQRVNPLIAALLVAAAIFLVDINVELGVATAAAYAFAVWVGCSQKPRFGLIVVTLCCSLLTLLGWWLSPMGGETWKVIVNRMLSLGGIWAMYIVCGYNLRLYDALAARAARANELAVEANRLRNDDSRKARLMLSITEDLRIERKRLASSEKRFRDVVESAPYAVVLLDAKDRIVLVNSETESLFGYSRSELLNQQVDTLLHDILSPAEVADGTPPLRQTQPLGLALDRYGIHRDGRAFPVEIGVKPFETDDGQFVLCVVSDITERRQLEDARRDLTVQLEQRVEERTKALAATNEKLQNSIVELEQFAYVTSHDLQEPLRKVSAFCQMLKDRYAEKLDEDGVIYINFAVDGAKRMRAMISDLLQLSRVTSQGAAPKPCNTPDALAEALDNLDFAIEESEVAVRYGDLPDVQGDYRQLVQLFQNLISNSIKYNENPTPEVDIEAVRIGNEWQFSVRDNGIGIEPEFHIKIFEIFKRLHGRGEYDGTGIGLAICKKIVNRLGGRIWVQSEEGQGSTFFFTLPVFDQANQVGDTAPSTSSLHKPSVGPAPVFPEPTGVAAETTAEPSPVGND